MIALRVNGESINCDEAVIFASDRGFNYGDGLFETITLRENKLQFWSAHYQRLLKGGDKLGIVIPGENDLLAEISALCEKHQDGVVKIVITRGRGGRGYLAQNISEPTIVLSLNELPSDINDKQSAGICCGLSRHPLVVNPALAGIKHLNRIDQVIARNEWQNQEVLEALMLDITLNVIEGSSSNLFAVINDELRTAPEVNCAVNGVIRQQVIAWAQVHGMSYSERNITRAELLSANEVFVCNSVWGILPVVTVLDASEQNKNNFNIGNVTRRMQQQFEEAWHESCQVIGKNSA